MTTFVYFTGPAPQPFSAPVGSDGAIVDVHARRPNANEMNVNSQAPVGLAVLPELLPATWTLTCDDEMSEVGDALVSMVVAEFYDEKKEFLETHVGRLLAGYLPAASRITIITAGSAAGGRPWVWRHLHSPSEFFAYVAQESEGYGPVNAVYSPPGMP